MAKIVLGLAASHSPLLSSPPEEWETGHAAKDRRAYAEIWDEYSARNASWIGPELTMDRWQEKYAGVQHALDSLGDTFARVRPDVAVILGDDQTEVFQEDCTPALAIYWGKDLLVEPPDWDTVEPMRRASKRVEYGDRPTTYACVPELGKHLVESLTEDEFDVAHFREMPAGRQIGHAYNFICRRVMRENVVPYVPVLLNVFNGLNQPSARRCYAFGQALGRAISSWPDDVRVAVIASGGLSHTIIDEELDRGILAAMQEKDEAGMSSWPEARFHWPGKFGFGTGETKSWIATAGALDATSLNMHLTDYIAVYRASVGSGVGSGFAEWV